MSDEIATPSEGTVGSVWDPPKPDRTSRRGMLRRSAAVAAGAVGAAVAASLGASRPVVAGGGAMQLGATNISQQTTAIVASPPDGLGVYGFAVTDGGLNAFPYKAAISGHGKNTFDNAVFGYHETGGVGVVGRSDGGSGIGVVGTVDDASDRYSIGVYGQNFGQGVGIRGDGPRGGMFVGRKAQVRLYPSLESNHPTAGLRGDLFVDKTGRLWYCKNGGANAVWHQLA